MIGALCVGLSLLMLLVPDRAQIQVTDALASVLINPWLEVRNFGEDVLSVRADNARLSARVQTLDLRLGSMRRIVADQELQAGPAVSPGDAGALAPCQVTARKRARLATMIRIHSLESLSWRRDLPVITSAGFLGRLHTIIDERSAWVELLTAPDMAVGVELERTGLVGVLRPRAGRFVVELIGRDEDVLPGDVVITSGIAEIREDAGGPVNDPVPRGLPVGVVSQVSAPSDQIFKEILIQPAADFRRNETAFVVGARPMENGAGEATR